MAPTSFARECASPRSEAMQRRRLAAEVPRPANPRWLLLIHQIPPRPNYLRVKTGRQLAKIGAVALKNSVYVLPWSNDALEDFQWIARELTSGGGEATVVEANLLDGLSDAEVESLFHGARNADYQALADEAKKLAERIPSGSDPGLLRTLATEVVRLERKFGEVADLDFFGAPARERTARLLGNLRQRTLGPGDVRPPRPLGPLDQR